MKRLILETIVTVSVGVTALLGGLYLSNNNNNSPILEPIPVSIVVPTSTPEPTATPVPRATRVPLPTMTPTPYVPISFDPRPGALEGAIGFYWLNSRGSEIVIMYDTNGSGIADYYEHRQAYRTEFGGAFGGLIDVMYDRNENGRIDRTEEVK